jgi:hypothetical protein
MSNITWYVDGTATLTTKTGAPNAITSAFTLKTDATTVQGVASRDVWMRAVALDRQGGETETNWTVRVNNVPASQMITFPAFGVKALGDPDFSAGASSSSGLTVAYSNSNPAVAQIVDGIIHIMGAGTTMITASQPGNFDFKAATPVKQTLTVKARLASETPSGGGTVTGAGLYAPGAKVALTAKPNTGNTFLRWEDGSQGASRSLVMPNANVTVSAWFKPTTNVAPPVVRSPGPQEATVGVYFALPVAVESESLPAVTVTGLPAGLAYVPAAKVIAGVPTAAVSNKAVTVTAKNVNKTPGTNTFSLTVTPLPAWAQGAFSGAAGTDAHGSGSASLSVTALGAVSGKLTLRGTNLSFSAKSYASRTNEAFVVAVTAAVGKVSMPLSLTVYRPEITDPAGRAPVTLSRADGVIGADSEVALWRNVWKDVGMAAVLTNTWAGYYTAVLPGGSEFGSGYLAFTVDKLGGVKTVGKLADGTAVSLSGTLVLDEAGRAFAVLYAAPAAYRGGGLFGLAEFFKAGAAARVVVRPLDGGPFAWESLDPAATQVYGQGFGRELDLSGGWYDTVGNLYRYYAGLTLSVGTEGAPAPELLVGTNRHASAWWDPEGIALSVVTNRLGVMTGLSAPKAGTPVKKGLEYDYESATNAVGLTVSLTQASGVFKGSFKAWFDYAATHTPRTINYEGVLTPEREDAEDGVAGRGFFLWADKSQYPGPQGKPVPYSFNWSYDLLLLP